MKIKRNHFALLLACLCAVTATACKEKPTGDNSIIDTPTGNSSIIDTSTGESSVVDTSTNEGAHTHTYAKDWSKNATHHWKDAVCEHEGQSENGAHTWSAEHTCTVCDYQGEHSFVYTKNQGADNHEKGCACGYSVTENCTGGTAGCTGASCSVCNGQYGEFVHHYDEHGICGDCGFALGTEGLTYALSGDGNGYTVTDVGTATGKYLVIPSEHEGKPVTAIGEFAFEGCDFIRVHISDNVRTIGGYAFYDSVNLTSITLGKGVESIADGAFLACDKLIEVYNLSSLPLVKQGDAYGNITDRALDVYTSLEEPSRCSVTEDGFLFYEGETENYLLGAVEERKELLLPTDYQGEKYAVYEYAFAEWETLERLTVGDGVTSVGYGAFSRCTSLRSVTFGKDLTAIENTAFESCRKLFSVTIPQSVTSLGHSFVGCDSLVEVYNLSAVPIASDPTKYGFFAVKNVAASEGERGTFTTTDDGYIFYDYTAGTYLLDYIGSVMHLVLPERCNGKTYEIYQDAFYQRSDLKSVVIPDGVTAVGVAAFYECYGLESIDVGNGVTVIGENAFRDCNNVKTLALGSAVERLDARCFQGLEKLTDIAYVGSQEEWNAIQKASNWDMLSDGYTVHCTDGVIVKE